jgi:hypothetical protein
VIDPRAAMAAGRAAHAGLMLDACTITRGGIRTFDPVTQGYTYTGGTTVYVGPCRLKTWRGNDEQAAEAEVNVQRYYLDLPLTVAPPAVARRDVASVTASVNPALVGRVLVITDVEPGTTSTALRCTVEFAQ